MTFVYCDTHERVEELLHFEALATRIGVHRDGWFKALTSDLQDSLKEVVDNWNLSHDRLIMVVNENQIIGPRGGKRDLTVLYQSSPKLLKTENKFEAQQHGRIKGSKKLSKDKQKEVIDLFNNGMSKREIARKFGVSPSTIINYLKSPVVWFGFSKKKAKIKTIILDKSKYNA